MAVLRKGTAGAGELCPIALGVTMEQPVSGWHQVTHSLARTGISSASRLHGAALGRVKAQDLVSPGEGRASAG